MRKLSTAGTGGPDGLGIYSDRSSSHPLLDKLTRQICQAWVLGPLREWGNVVLCADDL